MLKNKIVVHTLAFAAIILGVVLCYHHTLDVPFVFDDRTSIVENQKLTDLSNFYSLKNIRAQRPLTDFTFALNYHFGELDVMGYHLINIFIHIFASLLVYVLALKILIRCGSSKKTVEHVNFLIAAAFAALIFATHPIQTQAVTYIVQRYTSMAALFYLAAVLLFIFGRQAVADIGNRSVLGIGAGRLFMPVRTILSFPLCFVFAMAAFLSKQSALSLPLMILMIEYAMFDRSWAGWKRKLYFIVPALLAFLIFVLYSTGALQGDVSLGRLLEETSRRARETLAVTRGEYLLTQFKVIPIYIGLVLWPVNQNIDHMYPFVTSLFQSWTFWGMLLTILTASIGIIFKTRYPVIFIGIFWFFIALSVESSLIPIRDAMFEHRVYLAMFGPAVITGFIFLKLVAKYRLSAIITGLALLAILCFSTYQRNALWLDPVELWADSISKNPFSYRAQYNYGLELARKNNPAQALEHFHESIRLRPGFSNGHYNAGLAYQVLNDLEQALKHYQAAAENDPQHVKARLNASVILARKGKLQDAADKLSEALKIDPENVDVLMNLAVISYNLGRAEKALSMLEQLLEEAPDNLNALINTAIISMEMGELNRAENYLLRAYRLRPGDQRIMTQMNRLQRLKTLR